MTSDALMIAAIDLLLHPDAALLNIPEVTFQVAFWATLAALVFGLRVAAAVRAAATLSRGPVMRELHLEGAATPRSPACDLARPRSA